MHLGPINLIGVKWRGQIVDNFSQFMRGLGPVRLASFGVAIALVVGLLIFAATRVSTGNFVTLYQGLDPKEAGVIITRLEAEKIPYQLKGDGTTIEVPEENARKIRMQLASDGLPTGGSVGYEIFDKGDNLGTTSFTQNLNNLRALEGELSRTIKSLNRVENARVHLVLPERQLFQREQRAASASVVIKSRGELGRGEVAAIEHLVATAVPGLTPDHVAIIDERGTLLANGQGKDSAGPLMAADQRNQEKEAQLRARITELVSSIVGNDKVRVQVTAEVDYNRSEIVKQDFDPERQVVKSTQTLNDTSNSSESTPTNVTVGANLPEAQIPANGQGANKTDARKQEETINYEISNTLTKSTVEAGQTKRVSAAVLVDGNYTTNADGTKTYQERSAEDLTRIENLVKTAIGFDQKRGDQVLVQNLQFAQVDSGAEVVEPPFFMGFTKKEVMSIGQLLIISLVALLVVLLVLRPMLTRMLAAPTGPPGIAPGLQIAGMSQALLTGPGALDPSLLTAQALPEPSSEVDQMINISQIEGRVKASSIKKVGEIIEKHPEEAIGIVRSWLYEAK
jgi:flagellar M-ring protein FliF